MNIISKIRYRKLALTLLLLSLVILSNFAHAKTPTEHQLVKDIVFNDINGDRHRLSDYRGKWLFLNFWAGYCSICQKEAPTLVRFQRAYKHKVTLLGINYGAESIQNIKVATLRNKYNYLIVPDQTSITNIFDDVVGTPTTIIISPTGRLVKKAIGNQSYQELTSHINNTNEHNEKPRIWDIDYSEN
jgi:thiol-disulfide isomerase/thioredoxin